jgi:hypothetical protein
VDVLVLDIEEFSDLFWGLSLDHVGYGLASDIAIYQLQDSRSRSDSLQERLDVEVAIISFIIDNGENKLTWRRG